MSAPAQTLPPLRAAFVADQPLLDLTITPPDDEIYEVRLHVDDLDKLETAADLKFAGEIYLPTNPDLPMNPLPGHQVFFVHRNATSAPWELAVTFAPHTRGTWNLNGPFAPTEGSLEGSFAVPVDQLLPGENLLQFNGWSVAPPQMWYRREVSSRAGPTHFRVPLTAMTARVELWSPGGPQALASVEVTRSAPPERPPAAVTDVSAATVADRVHLLRAARAVGANVLQSRIPASHPQFADGFHLIYDDTRGLWRVPHWVWAWGPAIKLLLDLETQLPADPALPPGTYRDAAAAAGLRSLDFIFHDPDHPTHDIATVRWSQSPDTLDGVVEYRSTADSLFLAGWGWMPLHAATGDDRFLTATRRLTDAAERLMDAYPVVPQDYVVQRERWTPHTLDESVFGMVGFERLHALVGDPDAIDRGTRFLDSHLTHMGQPDGLLARGWLRDEDRDFWDADIKGHLWVLHGYLSGYELTTDHRYLTLARQLAAKIATAQAEDGAWTHAFHVPKAEDSIDERAVAIGAWLFYEMHRLTGDAAPLRTARRALTWCLRHQDLSANPDLHGALPNITNMGHLNRRRMTILYSTVFFGHALLAELALPELTAADLP
ncbi:hypothetical protein PXH66_17905 [Synoicihabitans lomoniglobus]|uniref:Uncharacterized protein n=1 Tax=Synoicihabitans lomoniglobus TaxID=2909285 RepID=A0AAE9ZS41_9BACT|nr:hypothetical protein PXH66_17905 [Opitutaceae bacterium LMO-M01]